MLLSVETSGFIFSTTQPNIPEGFNHQFLVCGFLSACVGRNSAVAVLNLIVGIGGLQTTIVSLLAVRQEVVCSSLFSKNININF